MCILQLPIKGGNYMEKFISLSARNLDWEHLVRLVERTNQPVWLELDGTLQGVLLGTTDAYRLFGYYVHRHQVTLQMPSAQESKGAGEE